MPHLRVLEGLVDAIDRPTGHARVVEDLDPRGAVLLTRHGHQYLHEQVSIRGARLGGGEARVGAKVRTPDGMAEALIDLIAGRRDVDVAVLGLEHAGGNARGVVVPRLGWDLAAHQPA